MSNFKTKWKVFWRIVGECFMRSLTPSVMFFVAGLVLLMLQSKNFGLSAQMAWAALCAVVALAYNGFLMWICGGNHYEMLVSGNLKRRSAMQSGSELNMASYKFQKEYRPWKGFAIGAFVSLLLIVGSIVLGCNQTAIVEAATNEEVTLTTGLAAVSLIFYCLAGWVLLPILELNIAGTAVSFFVGCAFALLPVCVSGGFYIGGAYGRRNKTVRQQEIAARAAEEEANRPKKINYGGLPGTKPKKRK
ncbi:MAG: hypothetical protein KH054_01345 [Firmicutes bacterium]|nr:hypothetical protein [Clostridia bacterium]MBS5021780.1 hypothetical protein [Bacillota bacterium]